MTDCIEWTGFRHRNGYGRIYIRGSKPYRHQLAHRHAWEQVHGPIPEGMVVMHSCDNPPCINVDHLRLGTRSDNMQDMHAKGRHRGGRKHRVTECPQGHAYAEHGYYDKTNSPHCRICDRERHREARRVRRPVAV